MKRIFSLVLGALAMVVVALVSAFIAMRLAIHGREVDVPQLTGMSIADATKLASRDGLNLTLENRFYSSEVPAGRILAQYPAPGEHVRREWPVTITESLGPQQVSIPDLTGQSERAATVSIRRLSLDLGAVAHIAAPGDPGVVLAQTPPANSGGVDGPRVSLLISDPEDSAPHPAYVMPSLVGLSLPAASARAAAAGLRLVLTPDPSATPANSYIPSATPTPQPKPSAFPGEPVAVTPSVSPSRSTGTIAAQTPQAGRRVQRGDAVHVTLAHPAPAAPGISPQ